MQKAKPTGFTFLCHYFAGLWDYLKNHFQDLKETVMDAIMDIVQNQSSKALSEKYASLKYGMGIGNSRKKRNRGVQL